MTNQYYSYDAVEASMVMMDAYACSPTEYPVLHAYARGYGIVSLRRALIELGHAVDTVWLVGDFGATGDLCFDIEFVPAIMHYIEEQGDTLVLPDAVAVAKALRESWKQ